MPFSSEDIIRCDCPCGQTIPLNGVPYLIVRGYEMREADTPMDCQTNLVFVGLDKSGNPVPAAALEHLAAYMKDLAARAAQLAPAAAEPDPYLVAHFAVQEMGPDELRDELRARGQHADTRRLAAREEVHRRLMDGRDRDVAGIEHVALQPGVFTPGEARAIRPGKAA